MLELKLCQLSDPLTSEYTIIRTISIAKKVDKYIFGLHCDTFFTLGASVIVELSYVKLHELLIKQLKVKVMHEFHEFPL